MQCKHLLEKKLQMMNHYRILLEQEINNKKEDKMLKQNS